METGNYKLIKRPNQYTFLRRIWYWFKNTKLVKWIVKQVKWFVEKTIYYTKLSLAASVAFALGVFIFGLYTGTTTHYVLAGETKSEDTLAIKIEKEQNKLVDDLLACEGGIDFGKLDDNEKKNLPQKDKISYGPLQWKISTVQDYVFRSEGKKISNTEAIQLALDTEKAKALAKVVIFDFNGLVNWTNCANKHDFWSKVKYIRWLEQ